MHFRGNIAARALALVATLLVGLLSPHPIGHAAPGPDTVVAALDR